MPRNPIRQPQTSIYNHFYKMLHQENAMGMLPEFDAISGLIDAISQNMKFVLYLADERVHYWSYWQYKYYDGYTTAARPSEF